MGKEFWIDKGNRYNIFFSICGLLTTLLGIVYMLHGMQTPAASLSITLIISHIMFSTILICVGAAGTMKVCQTDYSRKVYIHQSKK